MDIFLHIPPLNARHDCLALRDLIRCTFLGRDVVSNNVYQYVISIFQLFSVLWNLSENTTPIFVVFIDYLPQIILCHVLAQFSKSYKFFTTLNISFDLSSVIPINLELARFYDCFKYFSLRTPIYQMEKVFFFFEDFNTSLEIHLWICHDQGTGFYEYYISHSMLAENFELFSHIYSVFY